MAIGLHPPDGEESHAGRHFPGIEGKRAYLHVLGTSNLQGGKASE
jgi:hypothetical protein